MKEKIIYITCLFIFSTLAFGAKTPDVSSDDINQDSDNTKVESYFKLRASPFNFDKAHKEKDISYGGTYVYERKRDLIFLNYQRDYYTSTDPLDTTITVSGSNQNASLKYDYDSVDKKWSYFILNTYKRRKEGSIYVIRHQLRVGPVGGKYTFIRKDSIIDDLSISYIPLYEYSRLEIEDSTDVLNPYIKYFLRRNIRHSWRFRIRMEFDEGNIKLSNVVFYRPIYDLENKEWDFKDVDFENTLKFEIGLYKNLSFGYQNVFHWDIRLKEIHGIPSTNITQKLSFNYKIDL